MGKKQIIQVQGTAIAWYQETAGDFISLTDLARYRDPERSDYILQNWLRNYSTIDFIGLWEKFNNPRFNSIEFDGIKSQSGANSFSLTPKRWIATTNAIGMVTKTGRYGGGTFAHRDIAFEFASWLSTEFRFYLIREFQRLKEDEQHRLSLEWNLQRTLAKINYRIHTDAIKEHLVPALVTREQIAFVYANEADLLNVALFGQTAAQWRDAHSADGGNLRDGATLEQLVVLSNMESINALLIRQGLAQSERLAQLNTAAITQMKSLLAGREPVKRLE